MRAKRGVLNVDRRFSIEKTVPPPFNKGYLQDCAKFFFDAEGGKYLAIYCRGLSKGEAIDLNERSLKTAFIAEPPYWLGFLKLHTLIYEIEMNPLEFIDDGTKCPVDFLHHDSKVTVLGIDSRDMHLKTLGIADFPAKFFKSLAHTFTDFQPSCVYEDDYRKFLARWLPYTLNDLWSIAVKSGEFKVRDGCMDMPREHL